MTTDDFKTKLVLLLHEELDLMNKAANILDYSFQKCTEIGIKEEYSYDELDRFESLTSRFARLSDILIQKLFRVIEQLELEPEGSIRDRINHAEKKEIIKSANNFVTIRVIRNQIAHEYIPEEIREIFKKVLKYVPDLLDSVKRVKNYCKKFTLDDPF
jgi:hypothetical protein